MIVRDIPPMSPEATTEDTLNKVTFSLPIRTRTTDMISNETLFHTNPITGEPQMISLGWMDDSMQMSGPTEEDSNYIADTGATTQDMQDQVLAYRETITQFNQAVAAKGGFTYMMASGGGAQLNKGNHSTVDTATCKTILTSLCTPSPSAWNRYQLYEIPGGGFGFSPQTFTDYTAEFLLTRGPYALIGYTWFGCTNGATENPRAPEWDDEYGAPLNTCSETTTGSGVFTREWEGATVSWNCNSQHGSITKK